VALAQAERTEQKRAHEDDGAPKLAFTQLAQQTGQRWAECDQEPWELEADRRRIAAGFADDGETRRRRWSHFYASLYIF
jgi:hypothetical protein